MIRNHYLTLNNTIYQIYNVTDFHEMKQAVLQAAMTTIPAVCGSILMADAESDDHDLRDPVCVPESYLGVEQRYLMIERRDFSRWLMKRNQSTVICPYRLVSREEWESSSLYQSSFAPFGLYYSAELSIVSQGEFLGVLSLYRRAQDEPFSEDELFLMELLSDHLNARFYREKHEGIAGGSLTRKRRYADWGLTAREAEIAEQIYAGRDNDAIAAQLAISEGTLRKHLQHIYRKSRASGRQALLGLLLEP